MLNSCKSTAKLLIFLFLCNNAKRGWVKSIFDPASCFVSFLSFSVEKSRLVIEKALCGHITVHIPFFKVRFTHFFALIRLFAGNILP